VKLVRRYFATSRLQPLSNSLGNVAAKQVAKDFDSDDGRNPAHCTYAESRAAGYQT